MRKAEDDLPDCWHETRESMWYEDVLPLSKTALAALFVVGMIYTHKKKLEGNEIIVNNNETHVDIWTVDREGTFMPPDDHRHLSVNGIFLTKTKQLRR